MPHKVLILVNDNKPGARQEVERLLPWLRERVEVTGVVSILDTPPVLPGADLCIVFGGDGTLLAAARLLAREGVPLLGVNMGKLGFLADFNVEHMQAHLPDILAGTVKPTRRMMLEVCIRGAGGQQGLRSLAANDVVISAGAPFRMIDLAVDQGANHISRYFGDGLVIATPTGSTGYTMSLGGPILEPTLEAITISPIAPHTLSLRPIVVGSDQPIFVRAARLNAGTTVIVDGQVNAAFGKDDVLEIRRSPYSALIFPHPGRNFFSTLAAKLQWGQSPHHPSP